MHARVSFCKARSHLGTLSNLELVCTARPCRQFLGQVKHRKLSKGYELPVLNAKPRRKLEEERVIGIYSQRFFLVIHI
jgi:hypothetical protein